MARLPREDEPARVAGILQESLVELIDLSLIAKQAHWNVVGPSFPALHPMLDTFADQQRTWSDDVAERLATLGTAPDGRVQSVAARTPIDQLPEGCLEDSAAARHVRRRLELVAERITARIAGLDTQDPATHALLLDVAGGLEKEAWLLRATAG
jgi:starvation-inducible DNA-binding protein